MKFVAPPCFPRYLGSALSLLLLSGASLLISAPVLQAEQTEDGIYITKRTTLPIRLKRPGLDLSQVASVEFWTTSDNGGTWLMAKSMAMTPALQASGKVSYDFTARVDGRYGFRICVVRKDGSRDPEPRSGQIPAKTDSLQIDSTAPEFPIFELDGLDSADNPQVRWAIRDHHPKAQSTTIEWRAMDGDWQVLTNKLPIHGTIAVTEASARIVRLKTTDLAGNTSTSDNLILPARPLPPEPQISRAESTTGPSNEEQENASTPPSNNANTLPSVRELEEQFDPEVELAQQQSTIKLPSRAELLQAAGRKADQPEVQQPVILPMPDVPEGHQEIVEPYFDQPAAGKEPRVKPETQTASAPEQVSPTPASAEQARRPLPPARDLRQDLEQARSLAQSGHLGRAQGLYQSLRGTALAGVALAEEMRVLRLLNRHEEAISMYRVAKSDIISEQSTCLYALLLIDQTAYAKAIEALQSIPPTSQYAREAYFLKALALSGLKQRDEATAMMRALQSLDDPWGKAARRWLQQEVP